MKVVARGADRTVEWWGAGEPREALEAALVAAGRAPTPEHGVEWAATGLAPASEWLVLCSARGPERAWGLKAYPTRLLPGHVLWRGRRAAVPSAVDAPLLLEALERVGRSRSRALSLHVRFYGVDADGWPALHELLARRGWRPDPAAVDYRWTAVLDVRPADEALLAGLTSRGRRQVRRAAREGLEVEALVEAHYADRLARLARCAFERTGGMAVPRRWAGWLDFARRHPSLVRIAGVFAGADRGPDRLVGFACGIRHGEVVVYDAAGSEQPPGGHLPLLHSAVWHLMRWARDGGATWLDLGGMPEPGADGGVLHGIAEFKAQFAPRVIPVAEEWVFDVAPVRSAVRWTVGRVAARLAHRVP